ncbi:MAG: Gx transporter family protein [Lachnospiraceae bacterium]
MSDSHTKKLTILSLYTAISLSIFMIEATLPALAPIPGVKLGLANIITLLVLVRFSSKDALIVLSLRIILATLLAGQAVSFIYSVSGGLLCLIIMSASNKLLGGKYIYLTSILGAVAHNTGQILAAFFVLRLSGILVYIPYLIISGIITGLFTGLVCHFTLKKLPKIN